MSFIASNTYTKTNEIWSLTCRILVCKVWSGRGFNLNPILSKYFRSFWKFWLKFKKNVQNRIDEHLMSNFFALEILGWTMLGWSWIKTFLNCFLLEIWNFQIIRAFILLETWNSNMENFWFAHGNLRGVHGKNPMSYVPYVSLWSL